SALLKLGSNYQIYDPFTRAPAAGGRYTNQPLAGNIIPTNLISPIAKNIISYYPQAEQAGTADGGNNLDRSNWPSRVRFHSTLYKFDHNLSDRNRLMFRINTQRNDNNSVDYFGYDNPSQGAVFWQESASFAFAENYSFSPSFIMDLRISDSSFVRAQGPSTGKDFQISTLGFPASLQNAIAPFYREFPTITINGYTALGDRTPLHKMTETRNATVTFFKAAGVHQLKFGGEFRFYPDNRTAGSTSTPTLLTLTEAYTRGPSDNSPVSPRGQALAALLFGIPTGGSLTVPSAQDFAASNKVWAGFIQDDWKVTRKLNVNFGLRYELETALTERFNRSVRGFDPSAVQPFEAQALANYAKSPTPEISASQFSVRGGLTFAGVGGQPHGVYEADTNNFMPRAGFAYSPDSRTVIRGGFGMYFGSLGVRQSDPIQPGYTQATQIVPSNDGGVTFAASLANPFPNGFLQPTGSSLGSLTSVGNSVSFFNPAAAAPRLMKYSLDIQRELPGSFVLSVGYLGSRGADLEVSRALSALPNQYLSKSPARDQTTINYLSTNLPSPFSGIPQFSGTGLTGSVISRSALLAPYPQFTSVSNYTYDGKSRYDGLNVKVEKRFSHGYLVSMTYTFSKFIEATSLLNAGDAAPVRAISTQDFPHHLALSAIYELPFGRGRRLLPKLNSVAQALLGGWDTSYIYTYQSGPPIPFGNVILTGNLHDVPLPDNQRSAERWFNTSVFNRNTAEQLASNLVAFSPRFGGIRAEAYNLWDMALLKNVRFHENMKLEFRAEAMNVFNQVTFGVPNTTPTSTSFGQVTAQKNVPRRLQLTLRLQF
ncbi:MAG: TonB-dependent receptor, partial [Candidatus Solibacter sp.]|nr:TonB-dependent receptor [Candidatus Solibacter sp.]